MRNISVQFLSGREVLSAYWGFLEDGGLSLGAGFEAAVGESIVVDVRIASLKKDFRLKARVVKSDGERTMIAFLKGEGQDLLLNAAWADSHDVPQRKHRRFRAGKEVIYGVAGNLSDNHGTFIDVSPGGCCLRGATPHPIGSRVRLHVGDSLIDGQIRWTTSAGEMGIEFAKTDVPVHLLIASQQPQI